MADYFEIIGNDGQAHRVRVDHSIQAAAITYPGAITQVNITNTIKAKAGGTAADLYTYTDDVPNGAGGYYARAGDKWRKCYEVNGKAVSGWTAIIHNGIVQGVTVTPVTVTPPPPAGKKITDVNIKLAAGSVVTTIFDDGTSETKTA